MSLIDKISAKGAKVLMPIVKQKIEKIDAAFISFVGPIGAELASETLAKWLAEGKVRPSDLRHYVIALGALVDTPSEREKFVALAEKLLMQL